MGITTQTRRDAQSGWYVYDRHANLLRIAGTLDEAEAWAIAHWEVVEIATKEEMQPNDYWYLLLAASQESGQTRDYQARIMRHDRVVAIGRDPQDPPRFS